MKRILSVLLSLALLCAWVPLGAVSVSAATSGTTGDCTWTLEDGHLTISGKGAMENYTCFDHYVSLPWGSRITSVTIEEGVTAIGDYAFFCCDSLKSVTIPNSVKTIGDSAFTECGSLSTVTIGDGVTIIGAYAFNYCTSLSEVTVGVSVTSIGRAAFSGCNALTAVFFRGSEQDVAQIAGLNYAYLGYAEWYYNVCPAGTHRFDNDYDPTCALCPYFRTFTITDGPFTYFISGSVNGDCATLTACDVWTRGAIQIPAEIKGMPVAAIGANAFENCAGITSVTIPDGVTAIGNSAFSGCASLSAVTIPDGVTAIGNNAFGGCASLSAVTIPDGVTTIGNGAFSGCASLSAVTIPNGVTTIEDYAFYQCTSLTSVAIPNSVTTIGIAAFFGCTSLASVAILGGVTTIGYSAFGSCPSLTTVIIPDSVTTIGNGAFSNCTALTDVYYGGDDAQRRAITLGSGNASLYAPQWHFNICAPGAHRYSADCDSQCDVCEWVRGAAPHVYDSVYDPDCNLCGTQRVVAGDNDPQFVVEDVTACYGGTFTVTVRTKNNPGVVAFRLKALYDTDLLELVRAEQGAFADITYGPLTANPFTFTWCDAIHPDNTADDVVVRLTFRAKEGVDPTQTTVSLSYDAEDVYNQQWESVPFVTVSGTVSLSSAESGDINGDGKINVKDLGLLQQSLNGWDVSMVNTAADVNGDGKVNVKDLGLLQQYLNGWDVELK